MNNFTIVTGGQSGIDTYALELAQELGIKTGGTAAHNYATEFGKNPKLKEYGLKEGPRGYSRRTRMNIADADFTIIVFAKKPTDKELSSEEHRRSGTAYTIRICEETNKPHAVFYADQDSRDFGKIEKGLQTYNFAGPRESKIRNKAQCKHLLTLIIKHLQSDKK